MKNPEKLLDLLAQDARLTPAQLAAMLGESEEDVAAAIKAYEKNSTILGYKTVVDWDKTSKESVTALIEVKITPQKGMGFDEIARQIYSHHQVESVYLMSGGFDLTVIISGRTLREVAQFVGERLASIEGLPVLFPSSWRRWRTCCPPVRISSLKNTRTTVWNSTRQTAIRERSWHGELRADSLCACKRSAAFRHSPLF